MSTWRPYGEDCPEGPPVHMDLCQPCPYFRGASSLSKGWKINCNWPRNGSDLALRESLDDLTPAEIARWTSPTSQ